MKCKTKAFNKTLIALLLTCITFFCAFVGLTGFRTVDASDGTDLGIITCSPQAKAENGKLTFRFWVDKGALQNYKSLTDLSHTYYNVIIDGTLDESRAWSKEGLVFDEWEYNLSNDSNVGFGYYDLTVDMSDMLTTPVKVVYGFTYYGNATVDCFSETVTYTSQYNAPAKLADLKMQIKFLEQELAEVHAESVLNSEAYFEAKAELDRLTAEYNTLKGEERIKSIGLIIASVLVTLLILILAIFGIVKILQSFMPFAVKALLIVLILGALGAIGYFVGPQIYNAILSGI